MRKLFALLSSLMLAGSLLTFTAAPVAAASAGACGDSATDHYLDGNQQTTVNSIKRVKAKLYIPDSGNFKPCTPNDGQGSNGPSVLISIEHWSLLYPQTAWVQAGIVRCVNGPSYCTGAPRLISEWREGTTGATIVRDLGAASYDTEYTFEIRIVPANDDAEVWVNGVKKTTWAVGSELDPGNNPDVKWFAETHDSGDGLGSNSAGNSTNIGQMQYMTSDGTWWNRSATCNFGGSNQIECRNNGSNGQYFYTVN